MMQHDLSRFTYGAYQSLLRQLQQRDYVFVDFPAAPRMLQDGARFVLMRHDIDMDLAKARRMAEIEAENHVVATYFFLVRSDHYNVFSEEGTGEVRRILNLGHRLALHFDCAAYPEASISELADACRVECEMLERWFGQSVDIVSYHRPSPLVLTGDARLSHPRPHSYLPLFTKDMHYCSDSRGMWRYGDPLRQAAFRENRPMHLLTHPIWWNDQPVDPRACLDQFLARRALALQTSLAKNCVVYENPNVMQKSA